MRARLRCEWGGEALGSAGSLLLPALGLGVGFYALSAIVPAPAGAISVHDVVPDPFPVDNWVGDAFKGAKDIGFGGLSIGVDAIAKLITGVFGALVNLLIPRSFVDAGVGAIKWLCAVPSFQGGSSPTSGAYQLNLPHVDQLRQMLTWIGVAVLPLGLIYAGGRSVMAPSAYGDSPQDVLGRVVFAAAWLAFYSWGWDAITHFSTLVSDGLLSIGWVSDGIKNLMGGLTIGSKIPAVAFPALIVELMCALALLGMILMKIALLVITTFLFVIGGLIGAVYPMPFGRKLLGGYLVAVGAVVALPAMWALLFTIAAALMLDAGSAAGGSGGFGAFITQMWVLGATFACFAIAIKLGFSAFGMASSTISSFTAGALAGGVSGGGSGSASPSQAVHKAHSLYNVGSGGAGRATSLSGGGARAASGGGAEGVRRTREPAEALRGAVGSGASGSAARGAAAAGGAAVTGGASAAATAGSAAAKGAGASAAAQGAPKAGLERAAAGVSGGGRPGPAQAPHVAGPVRSTPSGGDRGSGGAPPPPGTAPPESARQTPTGRPAGKPAGNAQEPPRSPRRSGGGKS